MKILVVVREWPSRWQCLIESLAEEPDIHMEVLTCPDPTATDLDTAGTELVVHRYQPVEVRAGDVHPLLTTYEFQTREAAAVYEAAEKNAIQEPDVILTFSGQAAGFLLRDLWPNAQIVTGVDRYPVWERARRFDRPDSHRNSQLRLAQRLRTGFALLELLHCDKAFVFSQAQYQQIPQEWASKTRILTEPIHLSIPSTSDDELERIRRLNKAIPEGARLITLTGAASVPDGDLLGNLIAAIHQRTRSLNDRFFYLILEATASRQRMAARLKEAGVPIGLMRRPGIRLVNALWQRAALHISFCGQASEDPFLLQAMASGCLVCASDSPYPRQFVRHRKNGLLISFHSPVSAAEECLAAIRNRSEHESLAREAQNEAQLRHGSRAPIRQFRQYLEEDAGA